MLLLAVACTPAGGACAADWGGAIGLASDNVERGYSLGAGRPAWLADLHVEIGHGWLVGVAASAERPRGQPPGARVIAYLDRRWRFGEDWSAKAGFAHYDSPWNAARLRLRYDELNVMVGFRGRLRASLAVSPNASGYDGYGPPRGGLATWAELTLHQPLVRRLSAEIGIGHAHFDRGAHSDHSYGNAGFSYVVGNVYVYAAKLWMRSPAPAQGGAWNGWDSYAGRGRYAVATSLPTQRWVASAIWTW